MEDERWGILAVILDELVDILGDPVCLNGGLKLCEVGLHGDGELGVGEIECVLQVHG